MPCITHILQACDAVFDGAVVLLGDVDGLPVLVNPGLLPGVALKDGEHDNIKGRVGRVQHLPPSFHAQATHLLNKRTCN